VREAAKVDALPTESTDMRMTAFTICGMTGIPASSTAITNGDALASAELPLTPKRGWLKGTFDPTIASEMI